MADDIEQAIAFQRAGRLAEAESCCLKILESAPRHAEALNILGIVSHQRGNPARAVEFLSRAVEMRPDRAEYRANFAAALRDAGRLDEAVRACEVAITLQPYLLEAHMILGLAHQGAKHWTEAERVFTHIAQTWNRDPRGPKMLGDFYFTQQRMRDAITAYREALARFPNFGLVHLSLGTILVSGGEPAAAEQHLKRAIELLPDNLLAFINYGSCLVQLGRATEAASVYEQARELVPGHIDEAINIGQMLLSRGERPEARKWFEAVLRVAPDNVAAVTGLAHVCRENHEHPEAIALYERAIKLRSEFAAFRGLADSLMELSQTKRAESVLREAAHQFPNLPDPQVQLGKLLSTTGDFTAAEQAFREALRLHPLEPNALAEIASILGAKLSDADRNAIDQALHQPTSAADLAALHFGLARVEDARNNYASAADHARQGNELSKQYDRAMKREYDPAESKTFTDRVIEKFTREFFARTAGFGDPSELPVFVVGLPRSGTSLIEQILASHPKVFGAGECHFAHQSFLRLPRELGIEGAPVECVDRATPEAVQACAQWHLEQLKSVGGDAIRVVDKMPDNYRLLGWLACVFPRARFIHCRRDLRDVALSCWMAHFDRIRWACDFEYIASRFRDYRRLMDHWREVLPVPLLEIDYEHLVADLEKESRRLIDWLGLEWDPACLDFHRTSRPVRTASATQVRQPIYSRSVGRWRHYSEALRPIIDEFGVR